MPTRGAASRVIGVRTPKQRAGAAAEDAAARHLSASGCRVLARNARYREGELDLVVRERDVVVFVEVRLRA
ncbi:MAG TPA: YraN family protein, partial [Burkholderiaceae bacterium]|nr:YraN family protein [Burkholderiaceae bacterium]